MSVLQDSSNRLKTAWVYKPEGEGPHPVITAIHGGPEGQSWPSISSTYQMWLQKLGAAVIRPNVRGSDGYGKHDSDRPELRQSWAESKHMRRFTFLSG